MVTPVGYDVGAWDGLSRRTRWHARGLVLVLVLFAGTVAQTSTQAYAFAGVLAPVAALVPTSVASSVGTGVGAVSFYGASSGAVASTATVGAASVGSVAVAPVALAVGAALLAGGALYLGWKWANGESAGTALDPAPVSGVGSGTSWDHTGASATAEYLSSGSLVYQSGTAYSYTLAGSGYLVVLLGSRCGTSVTQQTQIAGYNGSTGVVDFVIPAGCDGVVSAYGYGGRMVEPPAYRYFNGPAPTGGASAGPSGSTTVTTTPTSQCSGGGSVAGAAISYTGATAPADLPPIVAPACPAGETRTGFTTPSTFPDGATAPAPLAPWTVNIVPSGYPECSGAGAGSCVLVLLQAAPGGQTTTCNGSTACAGWSTDATPERATTATGTGVQTQTMPDGTVRTVLPRTRPDGSTMQCKWGRYTIPAAECNVVPTEAPVGTGTGTDVDGSRCDVIISKPWTWPLRAMRCAFEPSAGKLNSWAGRIDGFKERPPFSLISGGLGFVGSFTSGLPNVTSESCTSSGGATPKLPSMDGGSFIDPLDAAGDLVETNTAACAVWWIARVAVWVGGLLLIAHRARESFGGKG